MLSFHGFRNLSRRGFFVDNCGRRPGFAFHDAAFGLMFLSTNDSGQKDALLGLASSDHVATRRAEG